MAGILTVLIVGVTGSLAALGDTLFPASSIGAALAQDFSASSGWLLRWRWTHPAIAFFASVFLIWLLVRASRRFEYWDNRGLSALVLILLAAQYLLGVLDVVLLAPVWLQIVHLLGADVLWAALVVLTARLTLEPMRTGPDKGPEIRDQARNNVHLSCLVLSPVPSVLAPGPCPCSCLYFTSTPAAG